MITISDNFKRELELTIANTEGLYKVAISIDDFDWQDEQVSNLYAATVSQIRDNGGTVDELMTDYDVREAHEVVANTARNLQEEA